MSDIKSKEARSKNMAAIKSKDTKPEEYIRKLLFTAGYRYRKNSPCITGHPDLWLAKYDTAIFVHGCFWHRHANCKFAYTPKSNIDFWEKKFLQNAIRDKSVIEALLRDNIRCLVIWECTIKQMKKDPTLKENVLSVIITFLNSTENYTEV